MLFGSSGIRGIANEEITPQLALEIGEATAHFYKKVIIGHDPRTSSEMIKNALMAGLLSGGAEITDISLTSTPTLAYATKKFDIGIMVTASHNPAQYNGIKFFNPDGSGISSKQSEEIEEMLGRGERVKWSDIKNIKIYREAINDHINAILNDIGELRKEMRVAVDCGNGSTSLITPYLLQKMGCKVISLNAQMDGFFPSHDPEPIEENLEGIKNLVRHSSIDIAFAHDCDGDRVVVINKNGNLISNDKLLALLAKNAGEGKIVVPVNASLCINDYLPDAKIFYTKVGDVFVSQKLKEINGNFGGEPSGTWIFPSFSYCPDGIYAVGKIMKMMDEMNIEEEIKCIPDYHTMRTSISSTKERIIEAMKEIEEELQQFEHERITKIDGIRLDMHNSWILVRPSGTEPKIRITVEAREKEFVKNLHDKVVNIVKGCIK